MRFFTLIHICEDEQSLHNNSFVRSFEQQVSLYFACAKQLHRSLQPVGIELIVITNDKAFLKKVSKDDYDINILEMDFKMKVPSGLKFYSAHYKIEIYKYLSTLSEEYVALVDCDIICVNDIPECFKNIINLKVPMYYDITDQVTPAYTAERIIEDKERLNNKKSIGLWAGGEFIAGPPSFFEMVYNEIGKIEKNYFNDFNSFSHQGDEMLTSVAIENILINSDVRILDAGILSIIGRFWSFKPLHTQKPIDGYNQHFLLHLPSDKKFITALTTKQLKGESFFKKYNQHLFKSHLINNAFKGIKPYVKRVRTKLAF